MVRISDEINRYYNLPIVDGLRTLQCQLAASHGHEQKNKYAAQPHTRQFSVSKEFPVGFPGSDATKLFCDAGPTRAVVIHQTRATFYDENLVGGAIFKMDAPKVGISFAQLAAVAQDNSSIRIRYLKGRYRVSKPASITTS